MIRTRLPRLRAGHGLLTRTRLCLVAICGAGLALRLFRAWQPMPDILVNSTPDDAYYYFQLARNIAHGHNITLDGETLTNGFHPLWLAIITPVFAIGDRNLAVHIALTVGAVLGVATIVLVFDITRLLTSNPRAALLAAAFFALHPVIAAYSVNGLETSLTLLLLALTCRQFIRVARADDCPSLRDYQLLGLWIGLLFLARTDTAFVGLIVVCELMRRRGRWFDPRLFLGVAGPAALIAAPWLLWNLMMFGTVVQISGTAGGLLARQTYRAAHGDSFDVVVSHSGHEIWSALTSRLPRAFLAPSTKTGLLLLVELVVIVALIFIASSRHRRGAFSAATLVAVPFIGIFLALVFEAGVRWFVREWYPAPFAVLASVWLGLSVALAETVVGRLAETFSNRASTSPLPVQIKRRPRPIFVGLFYAGLVLVLTAQYGPQRSGMLIKYQWQPNVLDASVWLAGNTPPDARIGAFNAGIPSYFSHRTVVNLDGVVNDDAYRAERDCKIGDYARAKQIDYLVDSIGAYIFGSCGLNFDTDLQTLEKFGQPSTAPCDVCVPALGGPQVFVTKLKYP